MRVDKDWEFVWTIVFDELTNPRRIGVGCLNVVGAQFFDRSIGSFNLNLIPIMNDVAGDALLIINDR